MGRNLLHGPILLAALLLPAWAGAGISELRAAAHVDLKLDSNPAYFDSAAGQPSGGAELGAELGARLRWRRHLGRQWQLGLSGSSVGTLYPRRSQVDWVFSRAVLTLRRRVGPGQLELSEQGRHYARPRRDDFGFLRALSVATYRWPLATAWETAVGLERLETRYPEAHKFDYAVDGVFVEVRNQHTTDLSVYSQIDLQRYDGTATPEDLDPVRSPDEGTRFSGKLGFDWFPPSGHALSGTYVVQDDRAELGVNQIGGYEGHEDSQDSDAEFDLVKHKATVLYAVPLGPRMSASSYAELLYKAIDPEDDSPVTQEERRDLLWLSSSELRLRLRPGLDLRLRYLLRGTESTKGFREYTDHVLSVGLAFGG